MGLEPLGNYLLIAYGDYGGLAQLVEQTAHIRFVIGPSPIAAISPAPESLSDARLFYLLYFHEAIDKTHRNT